MATESIFPSDSARMYVLPELTPATNPVLETVAMVGLALDQAIGRPVSVCPMASWVVAESWSDCPCLTTGVRLSIRTALTGTGTTVRDRVAVTPSAVAVMTAGPGVTPLTIPSPSTVATALAEELQVTVRPVNAVPFESSGVAVNWIVEPTSSCAADALSCKDAIFGGPDGESPPHAASAKLTRRVTEREREELISASYEESSIRGRQAATNDTS
jgi:hypothetical protein